MTTTILRSTLLAAALGTAVGIGLAGCTAAPTVTPAITATPASQTKDEACAALAIAIKDSAVDMTSAMQDFSSKPKAAIAKLEAFNDDLTAALPALTEPSVLAVATDANVAMTDMIAKTKVMVESPKKADLERTMTSAQKVQTTFTALGTTCG